MSEYHVVNLDFNDKKSLEEALVEMGYKPVVTEEAVNLYGYKGDKRVQRSHITIPRSQIGSASNDIGFEFVNGKYIMHLSEYDKGCNKLDINKLKRIYGKKATENFIKKKNGKYIKVSEKQEGNKIKIRLRKI